jgi:predicted ribosomally synthesized peptide with SipW-like signal peptide
MKKNTKRTLVATLLVMLLSLTVLIGSTYAYFNDTAIVDGSVTTGILNTKLSYVYADTIDGSTVWKPFIDPAEVNTNWEDAEELTVTLEDYKPGDWTTVWIKFDNIGTLKYGLTFTFDAQEAGTNGGVKLLEEMAFAITTFDVGETTTVNALDDDLANDVDTFYTDGVLAFKDEYEVSVDVDPNESVYVCFQIRMIYKDAPQNKYQNKSATFEFNFDAMQLSGQFVEPGTNNAR